MNNQKETSDLVGQRQIRLNKLKQLSNLGITPYPAQSKKDTSNKSILENVDKLEGQEVTVAGRLISIREHGRIQFGHIEDSSSKLQLYIREEEIQDTSIKDQTLGWNDLNLIDLGDFIEATGKVTRTKRGEVSILVKTIKVLAKSLRPLPTKLEDKEDRYRRRYNDLALHPEIRERFIRRSKFWQAIREFLNSNGFVEINIPVLEHKTGGADAKPFRTHFDALGEDLFLRISHELPLKKLLSGGFEKVYDIGPRFRNEGIDDEHLPEHIAMEWYWAYADYRDGMKFTEELYKYVLKQVYGTLKFNIKGFDVDLQKDWEEIKFVDIIQERFGLDVTTASLEEMNKIINQEGGESEANVSRAADKLWKLIRKTIAGPAFLIDVPKFLSPLAKSDPTNPQITQRFHPIIAGSELANAFSELNDPIDQLERFLEQQAMRDSGDDEAHMLDIDFIEMLEYGMPPAVGFGLSERVFWFFEDVSAKEGVIFPQLKHSIDETTKKIYPSIDFEDNHEKSPTPIETGISSTRNAGQNKTKKMVFVISKELQGWQLTNTLTHLGAYLGSKIGENLLSTETFETANGDSIPADSQYPSIIMTAKPGQLYNLLRKVEEQNLIHLAFTQDMIDINDDVELNQALSKQNKEDIKYLGIGIFGTNLQLDSLTKKFSLYK